MKNPRSSFPHGPFIVCPQADFSGWNIELVDELGGGFLTFNRQVEAKAIFKCLQDKAAQVDSGSLSMGQMVDSVKQYLHHLH